MPARLSWATKLVDAKGPEQILEIGCGPGVPLDLACAALTTGHITGVDRSATAITRATRRNADHLAAGRATLLHTDLGGLDLPAGSIDTAYAVNVNVFWTTAADTELTILAEVLRPDGALHLVYETPGPASKPVTTAAASLRRHGFTTATATPHSRLAAVTGRTWQENLRSQGRRDRAPRREG